MNKIDLCTFWQVSDVLPSNTITGVTSKCPREDCEVSARIQETTCAGTWNAYNKDGKLEVTDNNRFTAQLCCMNCKRGWLVDQDGNVKEEASWE